MRSLCSRPSFAPLRAAVLLASLSLLFVLSAPLPASAATMTFGSPLSRPATLDTAENLNYEGSNIAVPGSVFHINHDAADTLLWNTALPAASPGAPQGGQVTSVSLEGCARQPSGAPAPLTQIHFQDLTPTPEGGAKIDLTTGAFEIPVCGAGGASGSTVTTYTPFNFCVSQGDDIGFNDEGGFAAAENGPPPYPAGVPYEVIGASSGATMASFVRNGGTNNGTTISPTDRTNHDGYASNANEELMLQATLATGPDASDSCPGGTKSSYVAPTSGYTGKPSPPLKVSKQTDGINHRRIVSIALYCHQATGCKGSLTLTPPASAHRPRVQVSFSIPGGKTTHVPVRVPAALVALVRKRHHMELPLKLVASVPGTSVTQNVTLRIF